MYDINGKTTMKIKDDEIYGGSNLNYIAIFNGRTYFSNYKEHTVTSLDLCGNQLWKYKSGSLQSPKGITTDGYGNVYVVGMQSKNVFVISKDGQYGRELFKCKVKPFSVHLNKHNNQLLVRDFGGATVYDVAFGQ